jgi:molybdopterin converting factor small subunit
MAGKIKVDVIGSAATVLPRRSYEVDSRPGLTLRDVLVLLSRDAGPGFREKVYDPATGKMNEYLTVFVNSREARSLAGPGTILEPGDVITIMPPMAGGCQNARPGGVVKKVDRPDDMRFKI